MTRATETAVEDAIIAAYRTGTTVREIGSEHGVTRETVHNILRRRGIPRRRRPGGKRQNFTADEAARMCDLRRKGWSKEELADEFHTSYIRVDRVLQPAGLGDAMIRRDRKDRIRNSSGYLYVLLDSDDPMRPMAGRGEYVFEHRLVVARSIGRMLRPDETVHHINGDRTDNRLENLQLRQGKHGRGISMNCGDCGSYNLVAVPIGADR